MIHNEEAGFEDEVNKEAMSMHFQTSGTKKRMESLDPSWITGKHAAGLGNKKKVYQEFIG